MERGKGKWGGGEAQREVLVGGEYLTPLLLRKRCVWAITGETGRGVHHYRRYYRSVTIHNTSSTCPVIGLNNTTIYTTILFLFLFLLYLYLFYYNIDLMIFLLTCTLFYSLPCTQYLLSYGYHSMWFGGPSLVIPIRRVRQSSVTGLAQLVAPTPSPILLL